MTLPCDSSRSVFPDNKVGKFTTMLAREVVLDGKYEVGLSELVMPVAQRLTSSHQMIAYTEADFLLGLDGGYGNGQVCRRHSQP